VRFILVGEPVPKGRPRLNKTTGSIYTPKDTVVYEDSIAMMAMTQRERYGSQLVKITALFFTAKKRGADIDNLFKAVADGLLKGGILDDDSQIVEAHAVRIKSAKPRVEITIEPADQLEEVEA